MLLLVVKAEEDESQAISGRFLAGRSKTQDSGMKGSMGGWMDEGCQI
jgi:hypothetical protein